MSLAIVIPVYNEEKNITHLINEWDNKICKYYKKRYKFIIINDGSTDNSISVLKKFKKNKKFKVISKKNEGHGLSCLLGYKKAVKEKFNFVLQIDSDNQCDPIYFKKFIYESKKNDVIFGNRIHREDGFFRLIFSKILSLIIYLRSGIYLKDSNVPYRLINIKIMKKIVNKIPRNIILTNCYLTYLLKKNFDIKWVNISFRKRLHGKTNYNFVSMFKLVFNLVVRFKK